MLKCDVLIVGGGIAGLSAAAEVPPELSVILADAGGAASTEIMGFSAPANEPDSPERMFEDTIRSGGGESDPALVRVLCSRALRELKRLERLGIVFDRTAAGSYDMVPALGTSFPRVVHSGTTTGKQVMERLARPVLRERVTELFTADGGAVAGARLESGEIISTRAVVLAGGGFAGLWKRSTWSKKLRGDALTLGMSVGARLRGVGFIQFEPLCGRGRNCSPNAATGCPPRPGNGSLRGRFNRKSIAEERSFTIFPAWMSGVLLSDTPNTSDGFSRGRRAFPCARRPTPRSAGWRSILMARPVSRGSSPRASVQEEFTGAIVSAGMRGLRRSYSAALPGARRHDMPPPRLDSRFGSRRRENSPGRKCLRRSLRFSIAASRSATSRRNSGKRNGCSRCCRLFRW